MEKILRNDKLNVVREKQRLIIAATAATTAASSAATARAASAVSALAATPAATAATAATPHVRLAKGHEIRLALLSGLLPSIGPTLRLAAGLRPRFHPLSGLA